MEEISKKETNNIGRKIMVEFLASLGTIRESVGGSSMGRFNIKTIKMHANLLAQKAQQIGLPQRFLSNIIEARDILSKETKNTITEERIKADRLLCDVYNAIYKGMKEG